MKRNPRIFQETTTLIWHFPTRIEISTRGSLITVPLFYGINYHTRQRLHQPYDLGNAFAEILCFLSMFPCLPTSGNIVAETKFASQEAKMFPNKFRNIFVAETMFPSLPTCFQVLPARETLFSRLGMLK